MADRLCLPSPEQSWGRVIPEAVGACEQCGEAVALDGRAPSNTDPSGLFWEGDTGHCLECGTAHEVRVDDSDDVAVQHSIATLSCIGPWVVAEAERCEECGFCLVDHRPGDDTPEVTIADLWRWGMRDRPIHSLAGPITGAFTVTRYATWASLSAPCGLLSRRRRRRAPTPLADHLLTQLREALPGISWAMDLSDTDAPMATGVEVTTPRPLIVKVDWAGLAERFGPKAIDLMVGKACIALADYAAGEATPLLNLERIEWSAIVHEREPGVLLTAKLLPGYLMLEGSGMTVVEALADMRASAAGLARRLAALAAPPEAGEGRAR